MTTRVHICVEALSWKGTPYVHMADKKGEGVDCAMLLVRTFVDTSTVPTFDPRPYDRHWYMHREEERYLSGIQKYAHRVEVPEPGDLALFRVGKCVSHGAICLGDGKAIHAYAETRVVEVRTLEEIGHLRGFHFHSFWSVFS